MFGIDPRGNVWYLDKGLHALDMKTRRSAALHRARRNRRRYLRHGDGWAGPLDHESLATGQGRRLRSGDPAVGDLCHADARLRTAARRDRRARPCVGDAVLGRPRGDVRPGDTRSRSTRYSRHAPYAPPFPAPYSLAVDDKNQLVWTNDFNSSRIYRLDATPAIRRSS